MGEKAPGEAAKTAYTTIDEYIALFPEDVREKLQNIRKTIRKAAPGAVEKIAWGMPTFHRKENLVHFAAFKNHIGFYPGADGVAAFAARLGDYKTSKGAIQFPLSKPVPYQLIADITGFRLKAVQTL